MDVYTQSSQKQFSLSGIIKLSTTACLCEYVAIQRMMVFPVTLWCVFTRFKTLKDLSAVAVEGGIVGYIFKIQ